MYLDVPVNAARETTPARSSCPGEIACWPDGYAIAFGLGRTLRDAAGESLQHPETALGDVKMLAEVRAGLKSGPRRSARAAENWAATGRCHAEEENERTGEKRRTTGERVKKIRLRQGQRRRPQADLLHSLAGRRDRPPHRA